MKPNLPLLLSLLCVPFGFRAAADNAAGAGAPRPNMVLIVADDLGYGDPGCYGGTLVPTPNIDRLAVQGVRCTDGYVTAPLCAPSRMGLLTGSYQQRFGCQANEDMWSRVYDRQILSSSHLTLPEAMRAAGYVTGHLGKWNFYRDVNACVDEAQDVMNFVSDYFPDANGTYHSSAGPSRVAAKWGPDRSGDEYMTDRLGRKAVEFIRKYRDKPFFLYLAFNAPHGPLHAKKEHRERLSHIEPEARQLYAAMVMSLDENVGRVLQELDQSDLAKNTLVFFGSDNGPARLGGLIGRPKDWPVDLIPGSTGGLNGRKNTFFEGGIREPFVLRWPARLKAGTVYRQPVSTMDLYPTFLAAAGGGIPDGTELDGVNLLPFLTGEQSGAPHKILFWKNGDNGAVREGDWKLCISSESPKLQLFNLSEDVAEEKDLSAEKTELKEGLHRAWLDWSAGMPSRTAEMNKGKDAGVSRAPAAEKLESAQKAKPATLPKPEGSVRLTLVEQPLLPLIQQGDPGMEDVVHGLEGGCVVKQGAIYHLFVTELIGEMRSVKTRLAHWTSDDRMQWTRRGALFESSGEYTGKDPRASLWAAPLAFDDQAGRWNFFYTAYRSKPSDESGWHTNYEGRIWRAVSEVAGRDGIAGPFKDAGVILEPDAESQPWEGLQGVDSFHIYRTDDRWMAFYGSAQTQAAERQNRAFAKWNVGLAESRAIAGPWKRLEAGNPVFPNAENPVVIRLASGLYVAVFDVLLGAPYAIGYTDSRDGLNWSHPRSLALKPGPDFWLKTARTPLGLIREPDGTYSLFYTGYQRVPKGEREFRCLGLVTVTVEEGS